MGSLCKSPLEHLKSESAPPQAIHRPTSFDGCPWSDSAVSWLHFYITAIAKNPSGSPLLGYVRNCEGEKKTPRWDLCCMMCSGRHWGATNSGSGHEGPLGQKSFTHAILFGEAGRPPKREGTRLPQGAGAIVLLNQFSQAQARNAYAAPLLFPRWQDLRHHRLLARYKRNCNTSGPKYTELRKEQVLEKLVKTAVGTQVLDHLGFILNFLPGTGAHLPRQGASKGAGQVSEKSSMSMRQMPAILGKTGAMLVAPLPQGFYARSGRFFAWHGKRPLNKSIKYRGRSKTS